MKYSLSAQIPIILLNIALSATSLQAAVIQLPQTGQSNCYDSSGWQINCDNTGQDGAIQAGAVWPKPRFTDNGNQTTTDKLTGLAWTTNSNLLKTRDPSFDADGTVGDGAVTWQRALDYIKKLNTENYLGFSDWRLPNQNELESLLNKQQSSTANWLGFQGFSGFATAYSLSYWSSTTSSSYKLDAYAVDLNSSNAGSTSKSDNNYLWPVRTVTTGTITLPKTGQTICYNGMSVISCSGTGQDGELQTGLAWPSSRFNDNGDQSVTDSLTGLIWSKDANIPGPQACGPATGKTWQGALDYIKCLNQNSYLGKSDWRLPNRNELASLRHLGQADSTVWLGTQGFSNVQVDPYWSSTSDASNSAGAWFVGLDTGYFGSDYYGYSLYKLDNLKIWPVRGGDLSSSPLRNGICGSANGAMLPAAPGSGLCSSGTAGSVNGNGPWNWTCSSQLSGSNASCSAYPQGKPVARLPKTGETVCYNSNLQETSCTGSGKDGEFQVGAPWPAPRFSNNSDQTITDSLTGLAWTIDANLMKTRDPTFDADSTISDGAVSWQHALDYIKKLNSESYLGHSDWRLPNRVELQSLVYSPTYTNSWLGTQGFANIQTGYYWSSSTDTTYKSTAFAIKMDYGQNYGFDKDTAYFIWPVRSALTGTVPLPKTGQMSCYDSTGNNIDCSGTGQDGELQMGASWPTPRFTDNGNLTATDNLTGLIWTKNANLMISRDPLFDADTTLNDGNVTWQHAIDYVRKLNNENYQGYNDWRLPNLNEILSLFDLPSSQLTARGFSNLVSGQYWSSSTSKLNGGTFWSATPFGGTYPWWGGNLFSVWPVRGGQGSNFAVPPAAVTGAAGSITQTTVTLNGTVNDNGATATVNFEYGPTASYGTTASAGSVLAGAGTSAVTAAISGLACSSTYHYRVVGTNSAGNTYGSDATFTTGTCPPVNGVCGSSNSKTLPLMPTTNLCSAGTASAVSGTGPWSWTCDGLYTGSPASCGASYAPDITPPTITLSMLADGAVTRESLVNVTGVAKDNLNGSGIAWVRVNGNPVEFNSVNGVFSYPLPLAGASTIITVTAQDLSGNAAAPAILTINRDVSTPLLTIDSPSDYTTTSVALMNISGMVETGATVNVSLNGAAPVAAQVTGNVYTAQVTLSSATTLNTIQVTATGLSGKSSSVKRSIRFNSTRWTMEITDPPQDMLTTAGSYLLKGRVADLVNSPLTITITRGSDTYTPVVSNGTFEQLVTLPTDGLHAFSVLGTDSQGFKTSVTRVINKGVFELPVITAFSMPPASSSFTVPLTFTASDNVGITGWCESFVATTPDTCTWVSSPPASHTFKTQGDKILYGYVKDAAGNISSAIATTSITVADQPMTVTLSGTGKGTVTSDPSSPAGISCISGSTSGCSASFTAGPVVSLLQLPQSDSTFGGWSGDCSGTGTCSNAMTAARNVTATFTLAPKAMIGATGFASLGLATASVSAGNEATILVIGLDLDPEMLTVDSNRKIILAGGYNSDYSKGTTPTTLKGPLTIATGSLTVEALVVK